MIEAYIVMVGLLTLGVLAASVVGLMERDETSPPLKFDIYLYGVIISGGVILASILR